MMSGLKRCRWMLGLGTAVAACTFFVPTGTGQESGRDSTIPTEEQSRQTIAELESQIGGEKWLPVVLSDSGVLAGDDLFFKLVERDGATVSLYPLMAPGQIPVTRGYPIDPHPGEARDHPHHRSLWIAHGDVNGVDYWTGKGQVHVRELGSETGDDANSLTIAEQAELLKDGKSICHLNSVFQVRALAAARWIDCRVTHHAASERVVFGDTKEGFFALRLHPDLRLTADPKQGVEEVFGHAINSEGHTDAAVWGKRARWVCYQGPVDGSDVSVVIMDHPNNLQHPTTWHARDYGLFAANPFGLHDFLGKESESGEFVLNPGNSLELNYRVLLRPGRIAPAEIEWWFEQFAGKNQ